MIIIARHLKHHFIKKEEKKGAQVCNVDTENTVNFNSKITLAPR
jgi:hypothetical protein